MIVVSDAIREARAALGLDLAVTAEAAGLDSGTLTAYEAGALDVPGDVLWRLSDVLGVPIEEIDSRDALARHLETMAVRFRAAQRAVPDSVRLAVPRAAAAARDYVELEAIAGRPSRYEQIVRDFAVPPSPPRRETWKSGRDLATQLRQRLRIDGPVRSMLDVVEKRLGIQVIWQDLPVDVAGYTFCDEIHGPAIVLNVDGRNRNALVRRFTLAHETCHVLSDREDLVALSRFDAYEDFFAYDGDGQDPHEIRANAFAIHLLAPERLFESVWAASGGDVRGMMTRFGLSFEAVRQHLHNYGLLPITERIDGVATTPDDRWKTAEGSELWYPAFDIIPVERRHAIAALAFELWVNEQITTSRLRHALRVSLPHRGLLELARLYLDTIPA